MEKITLENVQDIRLIKEDSLSPISPKCPRTDWIKNCSEKIRFDLSGTFQKNNISMQKNSDLLITSESWYSGHEKPQEQENTEITDTPITDLMSLLPEDEHIGSTRATLDPVKGCALLFVQDQHPDVANCDKLGSYSLDDAGGELAKFHTVPDAPDLSSRPDCKLLLESLEDEPPGGCNLLDGNGDEGEKSQCSVSQIRAFNPTSDDEEIRCQHGYTRDEMQSDAVFCDPCSQSVKAELCIQKMDDDSTSTFWSDYTNTTSLNPDVVDDHSGKLDQNEKKKLELKIGETGDVAVSETKGQVNESSLNKNATHCEAECAEGSTVDNNVVSSRNIVTENVNVEAGVFSGAKGEHAADEMIAKPRRQTADHTAVPARISQESAEGDNNVSPFSVTDPAIWSETDREAVRGHSSQGTAGAESPSLTVCEMKMPPLLFDVTLPQDASVLGQTQQFNHPCRTQQCEDDKEVFCRACFPSTNATCLKTGNEGHCLWKTSLSSSPKCPPVRDGREESLETVRHSIKERNLSGCFHASLETLKEQVFKGLESEPFKKDGSTKIKREASDENEESEKSVFYQGHEDPFIILDLSGFGQRSTNVASTNLCSKTEITIEKERNDNGIVGCEMLVLTKDGHHQETLKQAAMTQAAPHCFSQCSDGNISDSARALASTLPPHNAVVPRPQEVNPSYHAPTITPPLNCSDTLSPVPSVFTLGDRIPAGFDTFQKIQLSLEDDDKSDYSRSNSPLHTSLSGPRRLYHSMLEAEGTNQHEVAPEEEEGKDVERFKCHTENTTNLTSDYSCNDMPDLPTTPMRSPQWHVNSKSVVSPSNNICKGRGASHLKDTIEFDMKKQFDMVLKELHLYFEISASDFISVGPVSVPEQCSDVTRASQEETSEEFFSPELMHHKNAASGKCKQWLCSNSTVHKYTSNWWQKSVFTAINSGKMLSLCVNYTKNSPNMKLKKISHSVE